MNQATSKYLPAEWEPQSGVMLTWPHADTDWAKQLQQANSVFCELATIISRYEQVLICSRDGEHTRDIEQQLFDTDCQMDRVTLYPVKSNDSWARDHGPITVLEQSKPRLLDFRFNGWGNKYPHDFDNAINQHLLALGAFNSHPVTHVDLVLEGGSIESDGLGTILTTRNCLLSGTRNPGLNQSNIEAALEAYLGANRVLWLTHGELIGDDTDSHIDMLARFINADTICYMACSDPTDPHYAGLTEMKHELEQFRQADGNAYRLIELPFPDAIYNRAGDRLPASYCNFLMINQAVLLPVYGCKQDNKAQQLLADAFPDRKVIPVNCRPLIEQHGSLHCVTMQLPAGVLANERC